MFVGHLIIYKVQLWLIWLALFLISLSNLLYFLDSHSIQVILQVTMLSSQSFEDRIGVFIESEALNIRVQCRVILNHLVAWAHTTVIVNWAVGLFQVSFSVWEGVINSAQWSHSLVFIVLSQLVSNKFWNLVADNFIESLSQVGQLRAHCYRYPT